MKKRDTTKAVIKTVIIALLALIFIMPLIWMISSSLKSQLEVFGGKFHFFGERIHWENYVQVWTDKKAGMFRSYYNTLKIVVISILGQLGISSMAAYAFAKINFKGKNFIFLLFLASMMVPSQVTIIPRFILFKTMHMYNTHWAIILPYFFGATSIFMLRQFYMGLPSALMEAAKIDGAGHFRIYSQVLMPLTKPAMITLMVLTFISAWNEYLSPLIFITKTNLYVVSQSIRWYLMEADMPQYQLTMAASTSAIVPIFILFVCCQKYFVEGIATSGVKG